MNLVTTNPMRGMTMPGPGTAAFQPTDNAPTPLIRQYLRIALRWKYVIIGITATCVLLGLIATLLMTPKYTAIATIEIARESGQVTGFQGVEREPSALDQEFYQTQYGLLKSRALSERVLSLIHI